MKGDIKQKLELEMRQTFGERIRVAMAVSQKGGTEVSKALGVSRTAVHKWARGQAFPSSKHLMEFCELTGCTMDWVMEPARVDIRTTELPFRQVEGFVEELRSITYRLEGRIQ